MTIDYRKNNFAEEFENLGTDLKIILLEIQAWAMP